MTIPDSVCHRHDNGDYKFIFLSRLDDGGKQSKGPFRPVQRRGEIIFTLEIEPRVIATLFIY